MNEEYINNLNIEVNYQKDVEHLLVEYEEGRLTRKEYIILAFLAHSKTASRSYAEGYIAAKGGDK